MSFDDFNGLIVMINQKLKLLRGKLVMQFKLLVGYIVLGLLLLGSIAVLVGFLVSYWISLILIVVYFIGLAVIQRITARNQSSLEKKLLFNTALVLSNLNWNVLEPKFKIKAKLGYLGQWIEFHAKPQRRIMSTTMVKSPTKVFHRSLVGSSAKKKAQTFSNKKQTPEQQDILHDETLNNVVRAGNRLTAQKQENIDELELSVRSESLSEYH